MRALHALFVLLFGMLAACAGETAAAGPCAERLFEDDRFTVCTFDPEAQALRLAWRGADGEAYRGFDALARGMDQTRVAFAMNAGMFDQVGADGHDVAAGADLLAVLPKREQKGRQIDGNANVRLACLQTAADNSAAG